MEIEYEHCDEYIEPVIKGVECEDLDKDSIFNDQYTGLDEQFIEQYDNKSNQIDYPFVLPTLYANHISIVGKYLVYRVGFDGTDLITEYGQLGGKLQLNRKTVVPAGKKSLYQQAYQDARIKWLDQRKRRYTLQPAINFNLRKSVVMLANQLKSNSRVDFPAYAQYKLDGMRFTALLDSEGAVLLKSRENKPFAHLQHLREQLRELLHELPDGYMVDGELYIHGYTFQRLSSIIRTTNKVHEENSRVEAHIFDLIDTGSLPYSSRLRLLEETLLIDDGTGEDMYIDKYSHLTLVPTFVVNSREEIEVLFREAISEGYEGIMIRKVTAPYSPGRSNNILKYKPLQTDEGTIIDIIPGTGSHSDLAIFKVRDSLNIVTDIVPKGSHQQRREWLQTKEQLIGRRYQFEFQERIKDSNAPRNPVGLRFI